MRIFSEKYDFKEERLLTDDEIELIPPTNDLIYRYTKYVVVAGKLEKEIPIIALVYIERLLEKTGILLNNFNWRRLILIAQLIGSKIWDDDSLENIHFPKVLKDTTLKEINKLERVFLELIGYDLSVNGKEYAKYYFITRTLLMKTSEKGIPDCELEPIDFERMSRLQESTAKAEIVLKELHRNKGGKNMLKRSI
jgi:hypothetical protein